MDFPMNQPLFTSSFSERPISFPVRGSKSGVAPYKWTILFLFVHIANEVFHEKFLFCTFSVFTLNSNPLFFTSPRFTKILVNPVTVGNDRLTSRSLVVRS